MRNRVPEFTETLADLTDEENSLLLTPTRGSASLTSREEYYTAQQRKQKLNQKIPA